MYRGKRRSRPSRVQLLLWLALLPVLLTLLSSTRLSDGRRRWYAVAGAVVVLLVILGLVGLVGGDGDETVVAGGGTSQSARGEASTSSASTNASSTSASSTSVDGDALSPPSSGGASATSTAVPATPTTNRSTTSAPPAATAPPPSEPAGSVDALLAQLEIAPERIDGAYDRDDWPLWSTQPDGCSTRERVLIDESLQPAQVDPYGCKVLAGRWLSAFDGEVTEDPGDLDIDHLVPLAEAHRSGGWSWDRVRREAYANDLGFAGSLIAVSASSNRSKGDRDPARWQPPRDAAWCAYATDWVSVKVRWGLTADQAEVDALANMLRSCNGSVPAPAPVVMPPAPQPVPTSPPSPAPTLPPSSECDPHYPTICVPPPPPDLDCGDIPQYASFPVVGGDPHRFDGSDKDGIGCESN